AGACVADFVLLASVAAGPAVEAIGNQVVAGPGAVGEAGAAGIRADAQRALLPVGARHVAAGAVVEASDALAAGAPDAILKAGRPVHADVSRRALGIVLADQRARRAASGQGEGKGDDPHVARVSSLVPREPDSLRERGHEQIAFFAQPPGQSRQIELA